MSRIATFSEFELKNSFRSLKFRLKFSYSKFQWMMSLLHAVTDLNLRKMTLRLDIYGRRNFSAAAAVREREVDK